MTRYPIETLDEDEDDGTMPYNVESLTDHVVGHKIVKVTKTEETTAKSFGYRSYYWHEIKLDNGVKVRLRDTHDCCAYTKLENFFLDPKAVNHIITGVGTSEGYTVWHIYADFGDIMRLKVGWSCGNPFYYGYGFSIEVE